MRSVLFKCRLALVHTLFFCSMQLSAATIQWDGGGLDGQWTTPTNWVGDLVPGPTDDVLLNNVFVTTTYIVTLPSGTVTISLNSLVITPSGISVITVILPATNIANPGLAITGPGNALVLDNNSQLRNSSGAGSGPGVSITNIFRINNGGHYIHNTARGNALIVSQLSTAPGTELGIFEFDVPAAAYILSLSGRNYGTLRLSAIANGGATTYIGSGASPCNVRGDLEINTGVNFSLSMSADFIIARHFNQATSTQFDLQTAANNNAVRIGGNVTTQGTITESGTGISLFELNGTSLQLINPGGSTFSNSVEFRLNNAAGASLQASMGISYLTSIQSGNLLLNNFSFFTSSFNSVSAPTLTTNHIVTNGSGELIMSVNAATPLVFPIGPSTSTYNPVTINSPTGSVFAARVETGINPPIAFPSYGINRTWNLRAPANVPNVTVTFQYATADANINALPPQDMEILMYAGVAWNILPGNNNITPAGADPAWTITTSNPITVPAIARPYALGVDGGYTLPLDCLISCQGKKINNQGMIKWSVNSCALVSSFELEKKMENGEFRSIAKIIPGIERDYEYNLGNLPAGRSYYIICINKTNGEKKYADIIFLEGDKINFKSSMHPTIIRENGMLVINAIENETAFIIFSDVSGKILRKLETILSPGENRVRFNAEDIPHGVNFYLIKTRRAISKGKFIRQ